MKYTVEFITKVPVGRNTFEFQFKKPIGFSYLAGQFISAYIGNDMREFTLVSSPDQEYISFATRIRESEFKRSLNRLETEDLIEIEGPFGLFTLTQNDNKKVFITGGIGITPVVSMIRSGLEKAIILHSFRNSEDAAYIDTILDSKNQLICFQTEGILPSHLHGFSGRISLESLQQVLSADMVTTTDFYVSGTFGFINSMIEHLFSLKIPEKLIKVDSFSGY